MISKKYKFKYKHWGDNKYLSELIWSLFEGDFNFVIFDWRDLNEEYYKEALDYYSSTKEKLGSLEYTSFPNFVSKETFDLFPDSDSFGKFHVIKPKDIQSVEAVFTFTSGDEEIHMFSSDFSVSEIVDLLKSYGEDVFFKDDGFMSDYFVSKKAEIFSNKKLCILDTYADDEDKDQYFVITPRQDIAKKLESM